MRLTEWFVNGAIAVLVVCALVVTGLRVRDSFISPAQAEASVGWRAPRPVANWRSYGTHGDRMGAATAAVTIVEFADFQCPFCRRAAPTLRTLRQRYPQALAVVYRHYPGHEFSFRAAIASECAARDGAFEAIHDALYAQADSIGRKPWTRFAYESGVRDTAQFSRCLSDPAIAQSIVRDTVDATRLGLRGTPTLLINDVMMTGYQPSQLDSLVNQMLARGGAAQ